MYFRGWREQREASTQNGKKIEEKGGGGNGSTVILAGCSKKEVISHIRCEIREGKEKEKERMRKINPPNGGERGEKGRGTKNC